MDAFFVGAQGEALRKQYQNAEGTFTALLVHFQRLTARFDKPALSAVAQKQRRHCGFLLPEKEYWQIAPSES